MSKNAFFPDLYLPELGHGSGMALLGFRACAFGQTEGHCIGRMFDHFFRDDSGAVLGNLLALVRFMSNDGRRTIVLAPTGCGGLTYDEASLLCCLSAAQLGNAAVRDAYLSWLLAMDPSHFVRVMADEIARTFDRHALAIVPPPAASRARVPARPSPLRVVDGGRA